MFKKVLFSFLIILTLFQSTARPAFAQQSLWYDSSILNWYTKVYGPTNQANEIFGERYTAAQVQWVLYSIIVVPMHMTFGSEFTACAIEAAVTSKPIKPCFTKAGTIIETLNKLANLISGADTNKPKNLALTQLIFQDRELSGITYTKNFIRRINLVPEVQAQQSGFGFGRLTFLQDAWQKSRDISYGLLIFAAIVMAFMIMFRTKISPQAVITAQSAIPQLIVAIILITFSYAIAGLMIDLVYVVIGIIAAVLAPVPDRVSTVYNFLTVGPLTRIGGGGILGMLAFYSLVVPWTLILGLFSNTLGSGGFGLIINTSTLILLITLVALMFASVILAFAFLRILFMMIRTLVNVYLLTIFGPFYILGGTLTKSLGFGSWIKDLISNLAVFPIVGILFLYAIQFLKWGIESFISGGDVPEEIGRILSGIFRNMLGEDLIASGTQQGWSPPLLGFGGGNVGGGLLLILVSLSLILLIPKVADIIKGFMSGRPFAYGTAIGEAVTGTARGISAATSIPAETRRYFAARNPFNAVRARN